MNWLKVARLSLSKQVWSTPSLPLNGVNGTDAEESWAAISDKKTTTVRDRYCGLNSMEERNPCQTKFRRLSP